MADAGDTSREWQTMGLMVGLLRGLSQVIGTLLIACLVYLAFQVAVEFGDELGEPWADAAAARDRLVTLRQEVEQAEYERRQSFRELLDLRQQVLKLEQSRPSYFTNEFPYTQFKQRWQHEAKITALTAVSGRLQQAEQIQQQAAARVAALQQEVGDLEQQIDAAFATPTGRVLVVVEEHWRVGLLVGGAVLLLPLISRAVWYFLLAPVAAWAKPVCLTPVRRQRGDFSCTQAFKRLTVDLGPGESLYARAACVKDYPAAAGKRTRLVWNWAAPLVSYAAGLWELTRVDGGESGCSVSLWSGDDADQQLVLINLSDHPGLVFRPRHLVGVIHQPEKLRLRRKWRLLSLHAWCTLQLRYILLEGTGRVVLSALGGIEAAAPASEERCVTQSAVAGFEGHLRYAVRRNETFWPYLRGREPLFDDCFAGEGFYLVAVAGDQRGQSAGIDGWFDRIVGVVGKVLGF